VQAVSGIVPAVMRKFKKKFTNEQKKKLPSKKRTELSTFGKKAEEDLVKMR
jgi:hypothetical protein